MSGSDFGLLSFHGTLLGFHLARRLLCHRALAEHADFVPLTLAFGDDNGLRAVLPPENAAVRQGLEAALADLALGPGLAPGTTFLRRRGLYLTAHPGGAVSVFAAECLGWESFLPLTAPNLALLRRLLNDSWTPSGAASPIPSTEIRLGANFRLRFGTVEVDLAQALPHAEGERIVLTPRQPGQAPVTVSPLRGASPARPPPKIWIMPLGNTANRALQYLTAEAMREELPEAVIENLHLPEWGRLSPAPEPPPAHTAGSAAIARTGVNTYRIDVPGLADCLRRRVVDTVVIDSFTYNLDQFPARAASRRLLGETATGGGARGFGPTELVCSVRAGEILHGIHGDYLPLPAGYYRLLADQSGLEPVFFGQIAENAYIQSLRDAFPNARFIPGRDPGHDFDTLRRSAHVALSISTFAWLAAWLGEALTIYLPVGGMFNPVQHPDQMYLPFDDPAYRFVLLPYAKAAALNHDPAGFMRQQVLLGQQARFITPAQVRELALRAEPLGKGRVLVGGFDPVFYRRKYPELPDWALEHYLRFGAREGRSPLAFDERFYVDHYPEAAMEIAAGLHSSPLRHFMAAGWRRGYAPTASAI